jgi:phosphoglycolate phosphatase
LARQDGIQIVKLVLFDIDGTLVLTGRAGGRAMWLAARECFGLDENGLSIPMAGRTDAWIVAQMADRAGRRYDPATLESFRSCYLQHLAREIHAPGPRKGVLPGVRPVLESLANTSDVTLGLLTGNFAEGAEIKLRYFDLWRYFTASAAFGDVAHDRNHLLRAAIDRHRLTNGAVIQPEQVWIVGDTPLDVAVAVAGGARSLAVATGDYTSDELSRSGADVVMEDLSDLAATLAAMGLGDRPGQ